MIVLDENFDRFQHDTQIIPLLHRLTRPTFFTWDRQFYDRDLRHHGYCLVHLDVARSDLASFTRRFLRQPAFRTGAQRLGTVAHVGYAGVRVWRVRAQAEEAIPWAAEGSSR